jgi:hypothetical protein
LGKTLSVQCDSGAGPQYVPLLLDDVEQPVPSQIGGDALGFVEDDAQFVQWLDDLDAVGAHLLVEPVLIDRAAEVHGRLYVTAAHQQERVLDSEVRVVADPRDEEDVAGTVVGVEVGAIVEVAVARTGPRDRLRDLVDREFVNWSKHQASSPMSRLSTAP